MACHWSAGDLGLTWNRNGEAESPMGTSVVVVVDVVGDHGVEVAFAEDQHPIQHLSARTLHPAFGESVRLGRAYGRLHHPHPFGAEDLVEGRDEFGIAVPNQDGRPQLAVPDSPGQIARLLRDPGGIRVCGAPSEEDAARAEFDEKEDVETTQEDRVDGEEVAADG